MELKHAALLLAVLALSAIPTANASITLGGGGNFTLTNPDNSTYFFVAANQTTFNYVTNQPDGWWIFNPAVAVPSESADYWVIGLVFGIIAIALSTVFMIQRRSRIE